MGGFVMSRTYRRRGQRHDYDWVLRDYRWVGGALVSFLIDPRSRDGRRHRPFPLRRVLDAAHYRAALYRRIFDIASAR
jgi:hypothetical protein